jgi:hypothetical protein
MLEILNIREFEYLRNGEFVDCCVRIHLCLCPRNNLTSLPSQLHTLLAFFPFRIPYRSACCSITYS